jgi:tripartite ATP-independent transporter DctM subunit
MIIFAAALLVVLIGLGFHIATAIGLLAISLTEIFAFMPMTGALGNIGWSASADFILVAVPMFIMMGQLMLHSGIARDMYRGLAKWLSWLPGGLMHTNIASCALFAASSGSSVATAATIGTMAVPNIRERGYNERLFLGTLAAGGTLGILIPPSIPMIVYGVLAEKSVVKLYLAALAPGVLLAALFSVAILVICVLKSSWDGVRETSPWSEKLRETIYFVPPIALFFVVIVSIYVGIATPTEAAALGLVASLILAAWRRMLTWSVLIETFASTMRTACMIMLIVLAAFLLNVVMVSMGMTQVLINMVSNLDWPPLTTFIMIVVFYLILGCFMETLAMVIATTPIIVPIIQGLGYDPIWFGVIFMILVESAMLTPPIGVNLYVIQSVREPGPLTDVVLGVTPFLFMMLVMIGILVAFPQIALWLPDLYTSLR